MYEKLIDRESADEILEKLENEEELKLALELKAKNEELEKENNRPEWEKFIF
jgi:carbamoylphosphate synthase large subunit